MDIRDIIEKSDLGEPYCYLIEFDLDDIFKVERALQGLQVSFRKNFDEYNGFDIVADLIGTNKAIKLGGIFHGFVYFPKIKSACREAIRRKIVIEFNGYNYKELSIKYGYSVRHIYNIVKEYRVLDLKSTFVD